MELTIVSWPPCSGKTTFIKNNYKNIDIISSDKEIFLVKEKNNNLDKVNLNKTGIKNAYKKIENNIINNIDTIYDSTNLTKTRRKELINICNKYNIILKWVNILTDFNSIYLNWIKRWKDIKIESVFFLYSIYNKIDKNEWFSKIENINNNLKNLNNNNLKNLNIFLTTWKINKKLLVEENKDLQFLSDFWKQSWKNYFEEYHNKVSFLEDLTKEDKLALLYSDIKYFYQDFISIVKMTYKINYNEFINLFYINIIAPKVIILWLNKEKTYNSLLKLINIF